MNWKSLMVILALGLVVLAGCAQQAADDSQDQMQDDAPQEQEQPTQEEQEPVVEVEGVTGVSITNVPSQVKLGKPATITWSVQGSGMVDETVLYWGTKSRADVSEDELTRFSYSSKQPNQPIMDAEVPGEFSANIVFDAPLKLYVRARATVDGEDFWSEEQSFDYVVNVESETSASADEEGAMADSETEGSMEDDSMEDSTQ